MIYELVVIKHRIIIFVERNQILAILYCCLHLHIGGWFWQNMTPAVIASVETMLEKWKGQEGKEIEVFQEFRFLTSEVISRTAFGSSYMEGEKIFDMLKKLTIIVARNLFKARIPVIKYVPLSLTNSKFCLDGFNLAQCLIL